MHFVTSDEKENTEKQRKKHFSDVTQGFVCGTVLLYKMQNNVLNDYISKLGLNSMKPPNIEDTNIRTCYPKRPYRISNILRKVQHSICLIKTKFTKRCFPMQPQKQ